MSLKKENTLVKVLMLKGDQGEKGETGDIDNIDEMVEALQDVVYTKQEIDNDIYTKTQTDILLDDKANLSDVYTKTEADTLLESKADLTDVYTKAETGQAIVDLIKTATFETTIDYATVGGNVVDVPFTTSATDINKIIGVVEISVGYRLIVTDFKLNSNKDTINATVYSPAQSSTITVPQGSYIKVAYV